MPRLSKLKKRGVSPRFFTLIELLVVITIIAVLASILLPSLAKAKQQARLVLCQNNLHNIFLFVSVYADDNNSFAPPVLRGHLQLFLPRGRHQKHLGPDVEHLEALRDDGGGLAVPGERH